MLLERINLYLKLAVSVGSLDVEIFKRVCTILHESTDLLTNKTVNAGLYEMTRIIFAISIYY